MLLCQLSSKDCLLRLFLWVGLDFPDLPPVSNEVMSTFKFCVFMELGFPCFDAMKVRLLAASGAVRYGLIICLRMGAGILCDEAASFVGLLF